MKNVILALLLLISGAAYSQTTFTFATYNPLEVTAPDASNTHIVQFSTQSETEFLVQFPSGNAGTVKLNTATSTMTSSPSMSATTNTGGVIIKVTAKTGYKLYLKFSNTGDKVVITKW